MSKLPPLSAAVAALCVAAAGHLAAAPQSTAPQPKLGQQGKDVVWIPTPAPTAVKMLDLARVTPKDHVIDLGSGDGVMVIAAARRGATAVGVEFDQGLVEVAKRNAVNAGVADRATFVQGDFFKTDFSRATVLTLFVHVTINMKLRPMILDLKPGTRIVSNTYDMGDWKADETASVTEACTRFCTALLWIVPAKVAGRWRVGESELTLTQQFQMVSGSLRTGTTTTPVTGGRLRGDELSFTAGGSSFAGRVTAKSIEGTRTGAAAGAWKATRIGS